VPECGNDSLGVSVRSERRVFGGRDIAGYCQREGGGERESLINMNTPRGIQRSITYVIAL